MKAQYKGFDIDVNRQKSVGGYTMLYYSVFRKDDLWELTSGCSEFEDNIKEVMKDMKKLVDDYLNNSQHYED